MKRRTYVGVVGITALAGCSAITGDGVNDEVGKSFEMESGVELTVDQVEIQTGGSITLGNDSPISGASDAITFVLPHLVATNTTESAVSLPTASNFRLMAGGTPQRTYQQEYAERIENLATTISEPVSGDLFPPTTEIGPDEQHEGWLVFTVPEVGSAVSLELRVDDSVVTSWSLAVQNEGRSDGQ